MKIEAVWVRLCQFGGNTHFFLKNPAGYDILLIGLYTNAGR